MTQVVEEVLIRESLLVVVLIDAATLVVECCPIHAVFLVHSLPVLCVHIADVRVMRAH